MKITEKVLFDIASEASYLYILSGQKLIKNAQNGAFGQIFENLKLAVKKGDQKVSSNMTKNTNGKSQCDILSNFQTI